MREIYQGFEDEFKMMTESSYGQKLLEAQIQTQFINNNKK